MTDTSFLAEQLAIVAGYRLDEPSPLPAQAAAMSPAAADALAQARTLVGRGDLLNAAIMAARVVEASPASPDARALLGALQLELGNPAAATPHLAAAATLAPNWAEAVRLCGEAAYRAGDLHAARMHLQRALALRPDWPMVVMRLSEVLLKAGDYAEGWRLYRSRFAAAGLPMPEPVWDGIEPLWDKTVLILAEREVGDLVQFVRYADLLTKRGAKVYVTCPGDLVTLMETVPGVKRAIPIGMSTTQADYVIPLLSLPLVFNTTLGTLPVEVPYLTADEELVAAWKTHLARLAPNARLRVGLLWADAGEPSPVPVRSAALADLSALWDVPGVSWFALQQGPQQSELKYNETPLIDVSAELNSPSAIVAAVAALDLLIAVDTPAIHVAGALGRPAWAMLSVACDWRWLGVGETAPWYPSVRCFRQDASLEWEPVAKRMAGALVDVLSAG